MALKFMERLWERKWVTYPEGAYVPQKEKSIGQIKPSTISQKAAIRRLSTAHVSSVEQVLRRYSLSVSAPDNGYEADSDEEAEEEIEINDQSNERFGEQRRVSLSPGFERTTSKHREKSMVNTTYPDENKDSCIGVSKSVGRQDRPTVSFAETKPCDLDGDYYFRGTLYPVMIRNEFHKIMYDLTSSKFFSGFILTIILLNTAILIVSTSHTIQARAGWYFSALDDVFLAIYIMEIVLKLYSLRLHFFDEGWNILDFVIVIFNLIDFLIPLILQGMTGLAKGTAILRVLKIFRAVRAIRALRVLRTIRFLSNLQLIMTTVLKSIKSIGAIVMIISLFMYMFAVIGRGLYAKADPAHFGNLFSALFTLFQLLTLDDWFDIYETIINNDPSRWHIMLYLLLYILVEYFVFLNLFVAVLVDNFQLALEAQNAKSNDDDEGEHQCENNSLSDSEEEWERKDVADYMNHMTTAEQTELKRYFELLASIEYNNYSLQEQQRMLHLMVNLCVDTSDSLN